MVTCTSPYGIRGAVELADAVVTVTSSLFRAVDPRGETLEIWALEIEGLDDRCTVRIWGESR